MDYCPCDCHKSKPREFTVGEFTVGEVLIWLEKLDKLTGEGARVVHVRHLLEKALDQQRKEIVEEIKELIDEMTIESFVRVDKLQVLDSDIWNLALLSLKRKLLKNPK